VLVGKKSNLKEEKQLPPIYEGTREGKGKSNNKSISIKLNSLHSPPALEKAKAKVENKLSRTSIQKSKSRLRE